MEQKSAMKMLQYLILSCFSCLLFSQNLQSTKAVLIFTGDVTLANAFERSMLNSPQLLFTKWNSVGPYDAMMINLENAVTQSIDSVKKEYVFKMRPKYLRFLKEGNIPIVTCANNHTADFGDAGIYETIQALDSAKISHVGIGRNISDARKPVILTFHDIRFGFLGYGGVKEYIAGRSKAGTAPRSEAVIVKDIKNLRTKVDYIVVNLHWGNELDTEPDEQQIALAHKIIDAGADVIIGHHPHVLQGVERYKGKVIAYSLGNFIFGGNAGCVQLETAVLKLQGTKDSLNYEMVPVQVRNWQPKRAEGKVAERILQTIEIRSKIFSDTLLSTF